MAKIKEGQSLSENVRYSQKDKMRHLADKSKKGTKDSNGNTLSDFERGRNFGRSEEIGKSLGAYAFAKAKEDGDTVKMAEMQATRAEIKAQRLREREQYKSSKGKK